MKYEHLLTKYSSTMKAVLVLAPFIVIIIVTVVIVMFFLSTRIYMFSALGSKAPPPSFPVNSLLCLLSLFPPLASRKQEISP